MEFKDMLPYLVAIVGSFISYLGAKTNTEKTLNNEIDKLDKNNKHEIEKLMKQHEVDIENIKEKHQLELQKMEMAHRFELEKMDRAVQSNAMGAIFEKLGDKMMESPELQRLIEQGMSDSMKKK